MCGSNSEKLIGPQQRQVCILALGRSSREILPKHLWNAPGKFDFLPGHLLAKFSEFSVSLSLGSCEGPKYNYMVVYGVS